MQYPLISEYVSAIQDASDNLDELAHLVPVLEIMANPIVAVVPLLLCSK